MTCGAVETQERRLIWSAQRRGKWQGGAFFRGWPETSIVRACEQVVVEQYKKCDRRRT